MVWWAFNGMARTPGLGGSGPISCTEIDAWQRVHGIQLTNWELEMIKVFDGISQEVQASAP